MSIYLIGIITTLLLISPAVNCYYNIIHNGIQMDCEIRSYGIKTAEQLQEAINNAQSGDTIRLDPIDYFGSFEIKNKNNKYITIDGDNQCNKNTRIIGGFNIKANNWIISGMVLLNTDKAIVIEDAHNIRLINLVINNIKDDAIDVENSNDLKFNNLVIEGIGGNALEFSSVNNLFLNGLVIGNIGGIGVLIEGTNNNINIMNLMSRQVDEEVIKITGNSNKGRITGSVINGDSPHGEAWVKIDGNNFKINGFVGNGRPRHGFLINGCGFNFDGNICTIMGSNGFCIYLANKKDRKSVV